MKAFISLVVFFLIFSTSRAAIIENGFSINEEVRIRWSLNEEAQRIQLNITARTKGWIALGLNKNANKMVNSDIILGWLSPQSNLTVLDSYATEYNRPPKDTDLGGTNDVYGASGRRFGEYTEISFFRNLISTDRYDVNITKGKKIYLLYAFGDDSSVDYETNQINKHKDYGIVKVDFFSLLPVKKSRVGVIVHSSLMILAWVFLSTSGTFLARYCKKEFENWFYYHTLIQSFNVFVTFLSFWIIVSIRNFVPEPHSIIGVFVFIFTLLQPILGVLSHVKYDPSRKLPPIWPDRVHWYVGRLVQLLGVINIILGIELYTKNVNKKYFIMMLIPFIIWMFVTFIIFIYKDLIVIFEKRNQISSDPLTERFIELEEDKPQLQQIPIKPKSFLSNKTTLIILSILSLGFLLLFIISSVIVPY